jgi:hypothetical protein
MEEIDRNAITLANSEGVEAAALNSALSRTLEGLFVMVENSAAVKAQGYEVTSPLATPWLKPDWIAGNREEHGFILHLESLGYLKSQQNERGMAFRLSDRAFRWRMEQRRRNVEDAEQETTLKAASAPPTMAPLIVEDVKERKEDRSPVRQVTVDGRRIDVRNGRAFRNLNSTPRGNILDVEGCIRGVMSPEFEFETRCNLQSRLRDLIQMCVQQLPEDLLKKAIEARDTPIHRPVGSRKRRLPK